MLGVCRPAQWVQTHSPGLFWPTSWFCSKSRYTGLGRLPSPGLPWSWPTTTGELLLLLLLLLFIVIISKLKKKLLPLKKNHIFFKKRLKNIRIWADKLNFIINIIKFTITIITIKKNINLILRVKSIIIIIINLGLASLPYLRNLRLESYTWSKLFGSGRSADPRFLDLAAPPSPRHLGQASEPMTNGSSVAATTRTWGVQSSWTWCCSQTHLNMGKFNIIINIKNIIIFIIINIINIKNTIICIINIIILTIINITNILINKF